MRVLAGKRVFLTGAASGIGRAMALELARHQVRLYLVDIDRAGLENAALAARALGALVEFQHCDLSDTNAITETAQQAAACWRGLDILINNAGVAYYGPTHAMTDQHWERVLGVNLHAPVQLTRQLLPVLLQQRQSHILNVCSIAGLVPFRKLAAYQTTKFALVGFSQALRAEYYNQGLGVTALCPGFVRTNIYASAMRHADAKSTLALPNWFCATPQHVAAKAIRAIQANRGMVTVAPFARLAHFVQRISPRTMEVVARGRLRPKATAARKPAPASRPHVLQHAA